MAAADPALAKLPRGAVLTRARCRVRRFLYCFRPHRMSTVPTVNPAPTDASSSRSPSFSRFCSTASFSASGIVPAQVGIHGAEHSFGSLTAAAHFTEPDEPVVRLHFDDRPNEASQVAAVGVTQRRFQRHRDGGGTDIDNLHVFHII